MLSSIFIAGGVNALRSPKAHAQVAKDVVHRVADAAQPVAQKVAAKVEGSADQAAGKLGAAASDVRSGVHDVAAGKPLPFETETYVKVNAVVQIGAGALLALGKAPRLASTALAATIIPTTFAAHRFWEMGGEERQANQIHFFKNVSLLGGLIIAAVDTEGQPGLAYRASHLGHEAAFAAKAAEANAAVAGAAAKANAKAARRLAAANAQAAAKAGTRKGRKAAKAARKQSEVLSAIAAKHGAAAAGLARAKGHDLADAIRDSEFQDRAADAVKVASDKGRNLADQARAAVA